MRALSKRRYGTHYQIGHHRGSLEVGKVGNAWEHSPVGVGQSIRQLPASLDHEGDVKLAAGHRGGESDLIETPPGIEATHPSSVKGSVSECSSVHRQGQVAGLTTHTPFG